VLLLPSPSIISAQEVAPFIEEILVVGRQPGPRLWEVSKSDHTLYIFAYLSPLPKRMRWESDQVERILAEAQEFISLSGGGISFSFPKKVRRNPDGQKLEDVLPETSWEKYLAFTEEHFRRNSTIEKLRPLLAINNLEDSMFNEHDLTKDNKVLKKINHLAKRNRNIITTNISITISPSLEVRYVAAARNMLASIITFEQEVACFDAALDRMMENFNLSKQAANAWVEGDIDELDYLLSRRLKAVGSLTSSIDTNDPCSLNFLNDELKDELAALQETQNENWLAAVDKALTENEISFAVLNLSELFSDGGLLDKLEERGYKIKVPN
jgi:hypothetical protein